MAIYHTVGPGECISSIAYEYGFLADTIWKHSSNVELRRKRVAEHVLNPGDIVFIPGKRLRYESRPVDQRHCFVRKGRTERLKIVLLDQDGKPRTHVPYLLTIDRMHRTGVTDNNGLLEAPILPNAREGRLLLHAEVEEEYTLKLGNLDPLSEVKGLQARLRNLGFDSGPVDGVLGPKTRQAITDFQRQHHLPCTGEPDADTTARLADIYGC